MERWIEYCKGIIKKDDYETKIEFGEENGLVIRLLGKRNSVQMIFGNVYSFRIIEEGMVQTDIYFEEELSKYREDGFSNVIYQITDGKYALEIDKISEGYVGAMGYYHFVLITQNYNIDILAMEEPEISNSMKE